MKTTPLLFNGEMVRALLDGRKTQTRRVITNDLWCSLFYGELDEDGWPWIECPSTGYSGKLPCPYGQPGDIIWVKETTVDVERHGYLGPVYAQSEQGVGILDFGLGPPDDFAEVEPHDVKLRPSIFMKRKWSRITLRITDVRVERIQDISEADAIQESVGMILADGWPDPGAMTDAINRSRRAGFELLWDSINAKRGHGWDANPWVWALTFDVIKENVDQVLENAA